MHDIASPEKRCLQKLLAEAIDLRLANFVSLHIEEDNWQTRNCVPPGPSGSSSMGNIVTVKSPILLPLYERKCANHNDSFISSQFQLATEKKSTLFGSISVSARFAKSRLIVEQFP